MNDNLMQGAPPAPENRVTLENWRTAPYNRWSFRNVRNMVPTAPVRRDPSHVWPLEPALEMGDHLTWSKRDLEAN